MPRSPHFAIACAVLILLGAPGERSATSGKVTPARVGERLEYSASFSHIHVGSGAMEIVGLDTVDGHAVSHGTFRLSGGIPFFGVNDTTSSWFDTATFVSRRFEQHLHEGARSTTRVFQVEPERGVYVNLREQPPREHESVADPLDDVSFVYFVRTMPLITGEQYELRRYFQPDGNPVRIRVVRRERIEVPAGTFDAIVLEPSLTTSGIFSRNGHAQLWLSDDSARVVLQLKSKLSFGSISLYLTKITPPL
jgi:hypothetical protein